MNFSELIRRHLAKCGIAISQKPSKIHPFNAKNSTIVILICTTFSLTALSFTETNAFDESVNILIESGAICVCGAIYMIIIWKTSQLFELIHNLADTADEREYYDNIWFNKSNIQLLILWVDRAWVYRVANTVQRN